ncbi:hypothetical protein ElyMa_001394400 [Elysia marginata]|uniref:Mos1 transposase HTH domain-containing protein n=1 Tax=Elysia marginata TaxID=1093978 RepID=A0AAV4IT28_9GAST|nr:hypothetical protein ElyMa_001394400 [Elysia marginata]
MLTDEIKMQRKTTCAELLKHYEEEAQTLHQVTFTFSPKLKEQLRGNHYKSDEDVEAAVRHWFRQKCVDFFTDGMRQLVRIASCVWLVLEATLKNNVCMIK